jgi:hypothetical protein
MLEEHILERNDNALKLARSLLYVIADLFLTIILVEVVQESKK